MNAKLKNMGIFIVLFFALGFVQSASATDLIVVATKAAQDASKDWLGFLESKEIPVKLVTPDSFSNFKEEMYIIVLGSFDESKEITEIAKEALTADELNSVSKSNEGKMFYKPQAWNPGQKVILFLGPNMAAVINARKSTKDDWFEMLRDWFDIQDTEGFHVY
jgi:hypothetical protein